MVLEDLRALAKDKWIKHWHIKSAETLTKELGITEDDCKYCGGEGCGACEDRQTTKPKIEVSITKEDSEFFKEIGFEADWLASLANQYAFTRFHYVHKFRAFRCYRELKHVEWISVNDLGMVNEHRELTVISQKHQPLNKKKQIIKLPWR